MQNLSLRTAGFTDSVIRRMTRVSMEFGAINLSQGFPDFDPPKPILDRLAEVAQQGPHQYSVTWGAQNFREALAAKQSRFMGRPVDPDTEIVVTCGSTEAMMAAMLTVTNPGDKVVVFSPFYENYGADAVLSGAEPIYVPLVPPQFSFKPEKLENAFRQRPRAIILCNPSNPCGKVFTREELEIIAALARKYDVYVITDEVYEHIVYAPHRHVYMASLPGMAAAPCPRPIPSRDGVWDTSLRPRKSWIPPERCMTFLPSARRPRSRRRPWSGSGSATTIIATLPRSIPRRKTCS